MVKDREIEKLSARELVILLDKIDRALLQRQTEVEKRLFALAAYERCSNQTRH